MENENIILEQEGDMPEGWVTDQVFIRDARGDIVELDIPDDKEG